VATTPLRRWYGGWRGHSPRSNSSNWETCQFRSERVSKGALLPCQGLLRLAAKQECGKRPDKNPPQASTWPLVQPQLSLIHSNMVWQVPALRHLRRHLHLHCQRICRVVCQCPLQRSTSTSTTSPPTSTSLPTLPLPRLLLSPSPCLHSSNSSSSSKLCSSSNSLRAFTRNRYRSQLDPTFPQAHNMSHPSLRPLHLLSIRVPQWWFTSHSHCTWQCSTLPRLTRVTRVHPFKELATRVSSRQPTTTPPHLPQPAPSSEKEAESCSDPLLLSPFAILPAMRRKNRDLPT